MGISFPLKKKEEKTLIIENPNKYYHKKDSKKLVEKNKDEEIKKLQIVLAELRKSRRKEYLAYRNEFDKSEKKALRLLGPEKRPSEICVATKNDMIECLQSNPKETLNCQNHLKEYIECIRENKTF